MATLAPNNSSRSIDDDSPFFVVQLVAAEVYAAAANGFRRKDIIANPNRSLVELVVSLKCGEGGED